MGVASGILTLYTPVIRVSVPVLGLKLVENLDSVPVWGRFVPVWVFLAENLSRSWFTFPPLRKISSFPLKSNLLSIFGRLSTLGNRPRDRSKLSLSAFILIFELVGWNFSNILSKYVSRSWLFKHN